MLVLTRKEDETIRIGDAIEVTVVRVSRDRVRIGVIAPKNVVISRKELDQKNEKPQRASTR